MDFCRLVLVLVFCGWAAPVAAEDAVVIASSNPDYARGDEVSIDDALDLSGGGDVTLLTDTGEVRTLSEGVAATAEGTMIDGGDRADNRSALRSILADDALVGDPGGSRGRAGPRCATLRRLKEPIEIIQFIETRPECRRVVQPYMERALATYVPLRVRLTQADPSVQGQRRFIAQSNLDSYLVCGLIHDQDGFVWLKGAEPWFPTPLFGPRVARLSPDAGIMPREGHIRPKASQRIECVAALAVDFEMARAAELTDDTLRSAASVPEIMNMLSAADVRATVRFLDL